VPVLIDTSSWVEALRIDGRQDIRERVRELVESGAAVLCDMVLLELWNGARGSQERKDLTRLERDLDKVPASETAWSLAREVARRARQEGHTIPATDILIASCAAAADAAIETVDEHVTEAWEIAVAARRPG
jgi:hypothetical protein